MNAIKRLLPAICAVVLGPAGTAWAEVHTGTYIGDGVTSRSVTGIPFQPDVLIIKGDDFDGGGGNTSSAVLVTSSMPAGFAKPLKGNQANLPNLVQSLDPNGFAVGDDRRTNQSGVEFYYTAFRADRDLKVGSYIGNGGSLSISGLGYTPDYGIVSPKTSNHAVQRSYQATDSWPFWDSAPITNAVTGLDADGFTLGNSDTTNENTRTFHYVAWNEVAGQMKTGWYFGDGTDPHAITDVGFQPEYVIVKAIDRNEHPIRRFAPMVGDTSLNFMETTVTNRIVAFEPAGFRVGDDNEVNRNGDAYFYVAFGNGSKPPLTVTETSGRITVTSSSYFEMSFDTSAENSFIDLAGGINGIESLVSPSIPQWTFSIR